MMLFTAYHYFINKILQKNTECFIKLRIMQIGKEITKI